jgi:inorganic pyrophosphatase
MVHLVNEVERGNENEFNAIIEIPKGSRIKYEVDKKTGLIMFDRVLYSSQFYPCNYGFIPQTLWEDNDPIDVLVMSEEPLVPGCLVKCRTVGVMDMIDGGESDVKLLAVPIADPRFNEMTKIEDVNPHLLKEISHLFKTYKDLQNKKVEVGEWRNEKEAKKDILKSFELFDNSKK